MVGIIILNYNNSAQTVACLDSLAACAVAVGYKVCVVDNASRAEEYDKLLKSLKGRMAGCGPVEILRSDVNGGYARGNDLGCEHFQADSSVDKILVLNDDTRFTMDVITPMAEYLDTHEECGVVFPLVLAPDGRIDQACLRRQKSVMDLFLQATSLGRLGGRCAALLRLVGIERREFIPTDGFEPCPHHDVPDAFPTEVPPGSCMMLPKDLFHKIGWLDPNTFLYFEEHIISAKLAREGRSCVLLPKVQITHLGAQTTKKQPSKAVYKHWRNSYLYFMKEYSAVPVLLQKYLRFRTWLKTLL